MTWTDAELPVLDGKVFLITGANSGIGFASARALTKRGGSVILACRSPERAQAARADIGTGARAETLDLADLGSVDACAERVIESGGVDVLINNAGVMATPRTTTADGFEQQMGVNHLGHFALTRRLLPHIRDRVVTSTSMAHAQGKINFDDLMGERRYEKWSAYFQSKLANVLFGLELQRRMEGTGKRSFITHPGLVATPLMNRPKEEGRLGRALFKVGAKAAAQPPESGAWATLHAATSNLVGGSYIGPVGRGGFRGPVGVVKPAKRALDRAVARKLWETSEALVS